MTATVVTTSAALSKKKSRDLVNDLYYIDLRRYSRGITSQDAAGVLLQDGQEKLQVGASAQNLAVSAPDYST